MSLVVLGGFQGRFKRLQGRFKGDLNGLYGVLKGIKGRFKEFKRVSGTLRNVLRASLEVLYRSVCLIAIQV